MGENEKQRWVEEGGVLFIEFYLVFEAISRIVESMDLVHPKGFVVKGIESEDKTDK